MRRIVSEDEIRHAIFQPPDTTRAYFRGRAVARFNREIASIQWDEVCFHQNGNLQTVTLPHPGHAEELAQVNHAIRGATSFADFLVKLGVPRES